MSKDYSRLTSYGEIDARPWYRYGWPWFLMSFPAISIVLGGVMLTLSLKANNSLVVDDYYKQGKAINVRIERDRTASFLGLSATVLPARDALAVQLDQKLPVNSPIGVTQQAQNFERHFSLPESLHIRWVHVTQAQHDGSAEAQHVGGGRYVAPDVRLPDQGKYRLHLQPASTQRRDSNWRLVGGLQVFSPGIELQIDAQSIDRFYGSGRLE